MEVINIEIKNNVILLENLKEEKVTSYEIIYKENKEKKIYKMLTFNSEVNPLTKKEFLEYFKIKNYESNR
jgi:UTP-glucose-1-phosphate uridylyltransferase